MILSSAYAGPLAGTVSSTCRNRAVGQVDASVAPCSLACKLFAASVVGQLCAHPLEPKQAIAAGMPCVHASAKPETVFFLAKRKRHYAAHVLDRTTV
jgi:hypothetical protein